MSTVLDAFDYMSIQKDLLHHQFPQKVKFLMSLTVFIEGKS